MATRSNKAIRATIPAPLSEYEALLIHRAAHWFETYCASPMPANFAGLIQALDAVRLHKANKATIKSIRDGS